MIGRVLITLGILAAAVAMFAAAALALAALTPGPGQGPGRGAATAQTGPGHKAAGPGHKAAAPRVPAFAIARLREGARAALWSEPGGRRVQTLGSQTEFGSPVVLAVVKRRGAWLGVSAPDLPQDRLGWIRRDPVRFDLHWTRYSLHVDLSKRILSLRYASSAVGSFPVTVGAPGLETPVGRYGVTDALRFDESPSYGCCALALSGSQTGLPEDWEGGDRLAIHGTPGPVGGAESHGCIRATDATMRELFRRIPLGTPVFVEE